MSDYTKEDLQKAREWLAEHDGFCLRTDDGQGAHTAAQALAAFRAEARLKRVMEVLEPALKKARGVSSIYQHRSDLAAALVAAQSSEEGR